MANRFLNQDGLAYLFGRLKELFVAKDGAKVLSDNNYTDTDKQKVDGAVQSSSVGQANGICPLDSNGLVPSANMPSQEYTGLFIAHATAVQSDENRGWISFNMTPEEISAVDVHYKLGESIRLEVSVESKVSYYTVVLNLSNVDNVVDVTGYEFDAIQSDFNGGVYEYKVQMRSGYGTSYIIYKISVE